MKNESDHYSKNRAKNGRPLVTDKTGFEPVKVKIKNFVSVYVVESEYDD